MRYEPFKVDGYSGIVRSRAIELEIIMKSNFAGKCIVDVRFWSSSCCSCDKNKKITFTILIKRQNQLKFGKILHVLLRGEDQLVISLVKKKQSHSMISKPNRLPFKLLEKPN